MQEIGVKEGGCLLKGGIFFGAYGTTIIRQTLNMTYGESPYRTPQLIRLCLTSTNSKSKHTYLSR